MRKNREGHGYSANLCQIAIALPKAAYSNIAPINTNRTATSVNRTGCLRNKRWKSNPCDATCAHAAHDETQNPNGKRQTENSGAQIRTDTHFQIRVSSEAN